MNNQTPHHHAEPILSEAQIQRITEAVTTAEGVTSGEIVPIIVRQSDKYAVARWRMAALLGGLTAFLLCFFKPGLHPVWYLWSELPASLLGYFLGGWAPLQRTILAKAEMDEEVHQRAIEIFHLRDLHTTRDRTGVMVFVSLHERRVQILADIGISSKVAPDAWNDIVRKLTQRISEGELTAGICAAVSECALLLASHFPKKPDDTNELPNRPLIQG